MIEITALTGIVPSLNTPFGADGAVDLAAARALVAHAGASGCRGALALAAAGEVTHLSTTEWLALAEALAEAAIDRLPLVLSLTAADPETSLERARSAARLGLAGVLWQPPAGAALAEIESGIGHLSDAARCPLMLQDLDFEGGGLPLDWIDTLFARADGFASLKIEIVDAGPKYTAVLEATGGALHVAGGWAVRTMTDALARGVHAFMPTGMEPLYVAVDRLWRTGSRSESEALFGRLRQILDFSNRDLDHSIRFFKRMRHRSGLFATDRVRVEPAAMTEADARDADRLIDLSIALESGLVRAEGD